MVKIYIFYASTFLWVFVCIKFRAYACIYGNAMMGNKQPATWKLLDLLDLKIENICYVFISFYETMYFSWMAFFFVLLRSLVFFCVLLLLSFLLFLWIDTIAIEPYGSCCLVAVSLFFLHLIRFSLTVRTVKCATTTATKWIFGLNFSWKHFLQLTQSESSRRYSQLYES